MTENKRNYGIDLLRIVSMFMVVVLHILGSGGMLYTASTSVGHNRVLWIIEIACYCAVNCYAIISGYVGYKSKFKFTNIITLWLQVFFYTFLINLVFWIMGWQDFSFASLKSTFLPALNKEYWYFTAYFIMYMFIPVLNLTLEKFNKKQMSVILGLGFIFLSLFPTFLMDDLFQIMKGYSAFWLMYLYLIGGFLHKYNVFSNGKTLNYLTYYICLVLFTFLSKINIEFITTKIFGEVRYNMMFIEYTSPTILLCGIFLVGFFSNLKLNYFIKKLVSFFAPISFGVYLIHNNYLLLNKNWINSFVYLTEYRIIKMVILVFVWAFIVYLLCSFIDYFRSLIFKLFKVKERIYYFEKKYLNDLF